MKQMEETLHSYPMIVRCHRAFLVNLGQVEQIVSHSGSTQLLIKYCHESLPVSRSNMSQVKATIQRGQSDARIDYADLVVSNTVMVAPRINYLFYYLVQVIFM
jgi:hypothetical protein